MIAYAVIGYGRRDPSAKGSMIFPSSMEQIANSSYQYIPARITIPASVFQQRMENGKWCIIQVLLLLITYFNYINDVHY